MANSLILRVYDILMNDSTRTVAAFTLEGHDA
jgi:hypothetical protein